MATGRDMGEAIIEEFMFVLVVERRFAGADKVCRGWAHSPDGDEAFAAKEITGTTSRCRVCCHGDSGCQLLPSPPMDALLH